MKLSLVVPVYNEEESLPQLIEEIQSCLDGAAIDYEVILVDDGSVDGSFELMKSFSEGDSRIIGLQFRRNFGQSAALQAGIDHASGEVIALMDADLQNDPADIPEMLKLVDQGYELVAGWRSKRKDRFFDRRLPSMIANFIISFTTKVRLHDYGCTLKLIKSEVAKELRLYGEMHRFIPVLASFVGVKMIEVEVNHRSRRFGSSKYGISRTLRVILDLLTVIFLKSFLVRPMQVFGLLGLLSFGAGLVLTAGLSLQKLIFGVSLADRPALLLGALLILVGVQLLSLGLVADVVARTYHEAQDKQAYHIRERAQLEKKKLAS